MIPNNTHTFSPKKGVSSPVVVPTSGDYNNKMGDISTLDRSNNFNFLRLLFAILVLLAHSPELVDGNRSREILTRVFGTLSFGEVAVQGFFMLSGYMIIKSWLQGPVLKKYLKKRVARIYPGFIAATLFSIFFIGWLGASNRGIYFESINYSKLFFNIAALIGPLTPEVFKGTSYPIVNAPMWTLSYEFRCYIAIALLGVFGINKNKRVWLIILITLFILAFICSFFSIDDYHFPGSFYIFGVPSDILRLFSCFATGACFYLYKDKITYKLNLFVISFVFLISCLFFSKLAVIAFCLFGGYCIFYFSFLNIESLKVFQRLPDISYGIYLYGWPAQKVLLWYSPSMSPWLLFLLAWGISSVFGLISWHLIESPALRLVAKYRTKTAKIAW